MNSPASAPPLDGATLNAIATGFADAFNREDLDAVMAHFTDDAVYHTFDGRSPRGRDAVRAEFAPQFARRFGRLFFAQELAFVDAAAQTVVMTWTCEHHPDPGQGARNRVLPALLDVLFGTRVRGWQGLDVLRFRGTLICEKRTYARAPLPLLRAAGAPA